MHLVTSLKREHLTNLRQDEASHDDAYGLHGVGDLSCYSSLCIPLLICVYASDEIYVNFNVYVHGVNVNGHVCASVNGRDHGHDRSHGR